jgi:uncharacterized protein involved in type VI secretion and phage assembly
MVDRAPVQSGKRLAIHTVLDGVPHPKDIDPLLLVFVKGTEDVSQPYSYEVRMWRLIDKELQPIAPGDMINTAVAIDINLRETLEVGEASRFQQHIDESIVPGGKIDTFVRRWGVFETFNDDGLVLGENRDLDDKKFLVRQYSGTIVPAFKMMSYEVAYRVFEDKTVLQVIHELTDSCPNFKLDDERVKKIDFPTIPYCVQFGESTYNFLSRIMARFGIWYYFDHNKNTKMKVSTMVLGQGVTEFTKCQTSGPPFHPDHPIFQLTELSNKDIEPSALTVTRFQRVYAPTQRRARFGNFNILNPTDPITGVANVQPERDLINPLRSPANTKTARTPPDDDDHFRIEQFGAPVDQNDGPQPPLNTDAPNARAYATAWITNTEAIVGRVSGSTRNPALVPGFSFDRVTPLTAPDSDRDDDDPINEEEQLAAEAGTDAVVFQNPRFKSKPTTLGSYVVVHGEIEGWELSYSNDTKNFGKILGDLLFPNNMTNADILANGTAQGVNNYLQNILPNGLTNQNLPPGVTPLGYFGAYTFGGGISALTAAVPLLVQAIEKFANEKTNRFHCSFAALPLFHMEYLGDGHPDPATTLLSLPLPSGVQPRTNGPHLAVVIGQDGVTDASDLGQVFADDLGRVRVRFPWDRKQTERPGDQFKRGDVTCWVRVSEGWAGRHFGTQFLPRVGQEVIVDFIAGDPDRPVITGRVYNADRVAANLPFPAAQADERDVDLQKVLKPARLTDYRFTGLKTRSLPKPNKDATERYHLVRFDDAYNCEQYLIRAQGRLDVTAFAHSFETTHGNRHVKVVQGKDNEGKTFGGSSFATVGGEYDLHVGGNRYEASGKDHQLSVKGDTSLHLEGQLAAVIGKKASVAADTIVLEATTKITLKVGNSFVVVTPCGVYASGPILYKNSGGAPDPSLPVTIVDVADAATAEPGDKPNKRTTDCNPHPRGGGTRGSHTYTIQPAPACSLGPDGKMNVDPLDEQQKKLDEMQKEIEDLQDQLAQLKNPDVDPAALKAQRDLIRRRQQLLQERDKMLQRKK